MLSVKEVLFIEKKDEKQIMANAKSAYMLSSIVGIKPEFAERLKELSENLQVLCPSKLSSVYDIDKKIWNKLEDIRPEIGKKFHQNETAIENYIDEVLSLMSEREFEIMAAVSTRKKISMAVLKKDKVLVENNYKLAYSLSKYPILAGKLACDLNEIYQNLEGFTPLGLTEVHIVDESIEKELLQIKDKVSFITGTVLFKKYEQDITEIIMRVRNLISEREYQANKK